MVGTTDVALRDDLRQHTPRLDIQGLRAVAVIAVVAFHAGLPIPGGFVGVDIFFVISGYVIMAMLLREWSRNQKLDLRRFYVRRIKRLLPALLVMVLVTLALSFLLGSPFDNQQRTTALTAIGAMTMTANAVIFLNSGGYFAVPPIANPLLNTWSLSVEEQFYLIFPVLLIALLVFSRKFISRQRSIQFVLIGMLLLTIASFLLNLVMSFGLLTFRFTDPDWFAFYASPTRAWEFTLGAIACLGTAKFVGLVPHSARLVTFWIGILGIAASFFLIDEYMLFPGWIALLPVLSTALILVAGARRVRGESSLTNPVMVYLGDASYSWYLWHWPLISFSILLFPGARWAPGIAALFALFLATLSLRLIENPLRFSPTFTGMKVVAFSIASVGGITAMSVALLLGAKHFWGDADIQKMAAQVSAEHLWQSTDCNSSISLGSRGPECTWNSDALGPPVFLLGDSMAGALSEGVLLAAQQAGRSVMVGTMGACPFVSTEMTLSNSSNTECNAFVEDSLNWLKEQPSSDVFISSSLGYPFLDSVSFINPDTGKRVADTAGKEMLYLTGLQSVVSSLSESGHRVTVVLPPPGFPLTVMGGDAWFPSQCSTIAALRNIGECGQLRTEEDVFNETSRLFSGVSKVVKSSGGVVADPRQSICRNGYCSTNLGNDWLYIDGSHISVTMSERLAPQLLAFVR